MTNERASERENGKVSLSMLASKGRNVCRDVYRKLAPKPFTRIKSNRSNLVDKREEGCACRTINRASTVFQHRYCCRKNSVQPSFPSHQHDFVTLVFLIPSLSPLLQPLKSDIGLQAMNRPTARIISVIQRVTSRKRAILSIYRVKTTGDSRRLNGLKAFKSQRVS